MKKNGSGMLIRQYAYDQARLNPGKEVKILSERELCKIYNVSRPTVRKSLDELVAEGLLMIRKGYGTFTNPAALRDHALPGVRLSMGIIMGTGKIVVYDQFFWDIITEAGRAICRDFSDIRLLQTVHSDEKAAEEITLLNLDGLIWVHPGDEQVRIIEQLQNQGLAVMCVNRVPSEKIRNYVATDYTAAGRNAAEYLLKHGHPQTLIIADQRDEVNRRLFNGFLQVFNERGQKFDERLLIGNPDDISGHLSGLLRFNIDFTACFAIGKHIWNAIEILKAHYGDDYQDRVKLLTSKSARGRFLDCPYLNIDATLLGHLAGKNLFEIVTKKHSEQVKIDINPEVLET